MILDHVWRFEDQLVCRQVCKWWRNRIVLIRRHPTTKVPRNYFSLNPTIWACLNSKKRTIKSLEFGTCGRATLRVYNPDSHQLLREVKYEPHKEKVSEVLHDHLKRINTVWHLDTHDIKGWTEFTQVECAIL